MTSSPIYNLTFTILIQFEFEQKVELYTLQLWEGKLVLVNLLSYHVRVVTRFHFESAVVCPQIH
jgi:hypothetical protein